MNKYMTQLQMIIDKLNATGEVSRNWCLQRYCSRLGARIEDLEKAGWVFTTEKREGDYVYKVVRKPQVLNTEVYSKEYLERQASKKQGVLI
jgi:hypothetical protein